MSGSLQEARREAIGKELNSTEKQVKPLNAGQMNYQEKVTNKRMGERQEVIESLHATRTKSTSKVNKRKKKMQINKSN